MSKLNIKLIGLTSAIGADKDTVAEMLQQSHGFCMLTFKKEMVDRLVRAIAGEYSHEIKNLFYDRELKDKPSALLNGNTPRDLMKSFGTDFGRKVVRKDIWVWPVERDINRILSAGSTFLKGLYVSNIKGIVISDVCFDNEAEMIKRNGGEIWRIERENNPYGSDTRQDSERGIDERHIDKIIKNQGNDMNVLAEVVEKALRASAINKSSVMESEKNAAINILTLKR